MTDGTKRFGIVVVGDEILSGRRVDKHLARVIAMLGERGLQLSWAQYVGDDRAAIRAVFERTFAGGDVVFSTGGIGATPDDQTRQAAAEALGTTVSLHPEAERLIRARIEAMNAESAAPLTAEQLAASPEHRQRYRMGEFPRGVSIIPNPYNQIPGFSVREHWFVPGFPVMAWPMLEWVLDTHYADLFHQDARAERSVLVFETPESKVTPLMEELETRFRDIKVFSLPSVGDAGATDSADPARALRAKRHIELGVKGPTATIDAAYAAMVAGLDALGAPHVAVEVARRDDAAAPA